MHYILSELEVQELQDKSQLYDEMVALFTIYTTDCMELEDTDIRNKQLIAELRGLL